MLPADFQRGEELCQAGAVGIKSRNVAVGESAAEFTVTVRPSGSCRVSVTTRWGTCAAEITERVANEDELRPVGTPSGGNVDPDPGDEP